ncbi:MAG: hypothetical protein MZV63_34410 [Marinilabiliales bacterium]|nr:hypothetical protein [Marinilabiliales bacterium]
MTKPGRQAIAYTIVKELFVYYSIIADLVSDVVIVSVTLTKPCVKDAKGLLD